MKKRVNLTLAILLFSIISFAQNSKKEVIKIQTSGQCEMCKESIEKVLAYERGVVKFEYDTKTAIVSVEYNNTKTSPEKIRKAITEIGYDADDEKANPVAYSKLKDCCKKPEDRHKHIDGCNH